MNQPRLITVAAPRAAEAAVLLLHGGGSRRASVRVSPTQLSVLRMVPIAHRLKRAGRGRLAVYRLLNTARGWDTSYTPVQDARWAIKEIQDRLGDLPIGLVGHSLGGRAALLAADHPAVEVVVALAPWVYPGDSPRLANRKVLFVHGSADRIALPARSEAVARSISRTNQTGYICINGGKHAMLRDHRQFDGYAASFSVTHLCPDAGTSIPSAVRRVIAGESWVTV